MTLLFTAFAMFALLTCASGVMPVARGTPHGGYAINMVMQDDVIDQQQIECATGITGPTGIFGASGPTATVQDNNLQDMIAGDNDVGQYLGISGKVHRRLAGFAKTARGAAGGEPA